MWIIISISYFLSQNCLGIHLIDLPNVEEQEPYHPVVKRRHMVSQEYPPIRKESNQTDYMQFRSDIMETENDKDESIKSKIQILVQQTLHDTRRKIKSIDNLKERLKEQAPYKIGFILSMIKKARDILNELFNVAVKHRDEWKALEQLKIFELIVHTNVDTTNLVRQLVEIHVQHLKSTNSNRKRRVVLL